VKKFSRERAAVRGDCPVEIRTPLPGGRRPAAGPGPDFCAVKRRSARPGFPPAKRQRPRPAGLRRCEAEKPPGNFPMAKRQSRGRRLDFRAAKRGSDARGLQHGEATKPSAPVGLPRGEAEKRTPTAGPAGVAQSGTARGRAPARFPPTRVYRKPAPTLALGRGKCDEREAFRYHFIHTSLSVCSLAFWRPPSD